MENGEKVKQPQFETISIELVKRCNLKCSFCYAESPEVKEQTEMTTEEWQTFLETFAQNGGRRVLFTGGEIFLRSDLFQLVEYAVSKGLMVDLFSNGLLIEAGEAEFIARHINFINISIDGPEAVHDKLRGKKGSYLRTLKAVQLLHEAGARFGLQTMIVPENQDNLGWLVELVGRTKPMIVKLGHISKMGMGQQQEKLWLNDDEMVRLKDLPLTLSSKCNHYHTRLTTNIISAEQFRAFYPTFEHVLQPWMRPDGRILSCYVTGKETEAHWLYSTAQNYPEPVKGAMERRLQLARQAHESASQLPYFDFLQLISEEAEKIAGKN